GQGGKLQPVALINKLKCQQQHAEHHEADDAIAAIELGDVVDEYFHERGGNEQESLPANKSRAPEKSDHHQHGAVSHPQGGVGKVALDLDAAYLRAEVRSPGPHSHHLPRIKL